MIELFEMAEFVDNYIILQIFRQTNNLVIEIEIALAATTPPAGFLVFYVDPIIGKIVMPIEKF